MFSKSDKYAVVEQCPFKKKQN